MARLRDSKGRFIKAQTVEQTVPEVEQIIPTQEQTVVRSDIEMTGEAIVLGQETENEVETEIENENETKVVIDAEKPVKKARFNTENSRADAIEAALMTGASGIDEIVDTVMLARPNDDPKKVKGQIRAILRDIKDGRGRWKKYDVSNEEGMVQIMVK